MVEPVIATLFEPGSQLHNIHDSGLTEDTGETEGVEQHERELAGIEIDRVGFLDTALSAFPGTVLRTFLAPIINVKSSLFRRKRLTEECILSDKTKLQKVYKEAIRILAKALADSSMELFDTPLALNENELSAALKEKLVPVCYEPGTVLAYPGEFPETSFVHVVLCGSVQVVHFQAQNRKGVIGDSNKRQYFSSNETIRLSGSLGFQPELFRFLSSQLEASSEGNSDAASTSNISSAIQRTLWRASRLIGQPTLTATRTELFRAPYVCCVTEALGMEPFRLSTITAEAAGQSIKGDGTWDTRMTLTMRIRTKELHDVLMNFATVKNDNTDRDNLKLTAGTLRQAHTLADYIVAARVRAIARHYPLNEILMRQSWLLQDTPTHTIRVLVTNLTPCSYFPGEVILCPHSQNRNLFFLRRGTMTIEECFHLDTKDKCRCEDQHCRRNILEEVQAGASFGELSVLFGEPRQYILRAHTACDVWCLSAQNFAATMRRDDVLRKSLLSKAAALRMRWLGEQRYTASLAQVLRKSCKLFQDASDSFIRLVQERIEPVVYPPGTLLTSTSSRCEEMLIILHGKVASIVDGVVEYGPGGVIGEATIFPHRWPMGLVSKSMVEGWKLTRDHLLDALRRIEILRRHSGEVGSHTTQLMQQIFESPIPLCEVDAVGRSKMPFVGSPPCGSTYMGYAKWLAETQLRAFCFCFRDYVKWSDISYATLSTKNERSMSNSFIKAFEHENGNATRENVHSSSTVVVGSGANVPRKIRRNSATQCQNEKQEQRQQKRRHKKRRAGFGTTIPFYVNYAIAQQPFTQPFLWKPPISPKSGEEEPFLAKQRALTAGAGIQLRITPLLHLERLKALIDNRDKFQKAEAKQNELIELNQERTEHVDMARFGNPAPVHIFLQGTQPRVQITVEEAIAVGYVLQFPDVKNIQSCVSGIDSDVTIGLPHHRQRRRDMAVTPNMRHYRRCFLFAASRLSENSAEEEVVREATARDADNKEKAHHLTTLLMAELPDKSRVSTVQTAIHSIEEIDGSFDWHGCPNAKSLFKGATNSSEQSPQSVQRASLTKDVVDESEVIREFCKDPDKMINKLRLKFHLPPLVTDASASENCGTHSSFDATTTTVINNLPARARRGDLLGYLRAVSQMPDPAIQGALRSNHSLVQQPGACKNGEALEKAHEGGDKEKSIGDLNSFVDKEDMPLFVDGYGQLSSSQVHTIAEGKHSQTLDKFFSTTALQSTEECGQTGGRRGGKSAWLPRNFVMPSVSEATNTMRRMQRDVEGLNAVAMEQRSERLLKATRLAGRKDAFAVDGQLPVEYRRIVDDWSTDYAEFSRDPLYSIKIPSLLISEAGTNHLAEEFKNIRSKQLATVKSVCGVEMWRGEVDMKERREGKSRDEGRSQINRSVLAEVGAKALGRLSKPLKNPMSHMSNEQYQQWIAKRDAIFANAKRQA